MNVSGVGKQNAFPRRAKAVFCCPPSLSLSLWLSLSPYIEEALEKAEAAALCMGGKRSCRFFVFPVCVCVVCVPSLSLSKSFRLIVSFPPSLSISISISTYTYIHTYIHSIHAFMRAYMYIHACIHTYIHTMELDDTRDRTRIHTERPLSSPVLFPPSLRLNNNNKPWKTNGKT